MIILRNKYLQQLIAAKGNGMVKIVTGIRRSGKSFLLMTLFHQHLINHGVPESHIIEISLDNRKNKHLRNPDMLLDYIDRLVHTNGQTYYVILDEVQLVEDFVEVLLSLMQDKRLDVYVSGSNSKFLSKDIVTEFRGRGDVIHLYPLSFSEYYTTVGGDKRNAWKDYYTYGGLPQVLLTESEEKKVNYLTELYELTYLKDIVERNHLRNVEGLRTLVRVLASSIGTPTNPKRIANTFQSAENVRIKDSTIRDYISYLQDAFSIEEALRYDVKGRKYINTPFKYYFADVGLRNARINFRQQEDNHLMENVIYNELLLRGFNVDVGVVEIREGNKRTQTEVDFICNEGSNRYYIQSALNLSTSEKTAQESRSLNHISDNFKKIIIVKDNVKPWRTEDGILVIGIIDFLIDPDSLDR